MGIIIARTQLKRETGWLYYCGTDKDGNITVCKAEMKRGGKKKKKTSG